MSDDSLKVPKTIEDLEQIRFLTGTIMAIQKYEGSGGTANVLLADSGYGLIEGVEISYKCQEATAGEGEGVSARAFAIADEVLVEWNCTPADVAGTGTGIPAVEELRILGFVDGVPRLCAPTCIAISREEYVFFYNVREGKCFCPVTWPTDHIDAVWSGGIGDAEYRMFKLDSYSYIADFVLAVCKEDMAVSIVDSIIRSDANVVVGDSMVGEVQLPITEGHVHGETNAEVACRLRGQCTGADLPGYCKGRVLTHTGLASAYVMGIPDDGQYPPDYWTYEQQDWEKTYTTTLIQGGVNVIPGGWAAIRTVPRIEYTHYAFYDGFMFHSDSTIGSSWKSVTWPWDSTVCDQYASLGCEGRAQSPWSLQTLTCVFNDKGTTELPFFGGIVAGEETISRPSNLPAGWSELTAPFSPATVPIQPKEAWIIDKTNSTQGVIYGVKEERDWAYHCYDTSVSPHGCRDMECPEGPQKPRYYEGGSYYHGTQTEQVGAATPIVTTYSSGYPAYNIYGFRSTFYTWGEPLFKTHTVAAAESGLHYTEHVYHDLATGAEVSLQDHILDRQFGSMTLTYSRYIEQLELREYETSGCYYYRTVIQNMEETDRECTTQKIEKCYKKGNRISLTGCRSEDELFVFEVHETYAEAWIGGLIPNEDENSFTAKIHSADKDPDNPETIEWAEGRVITNTAPWIRVFLILCAEGQNMNYLMHNQRFRFWYPAE